MLTKISALKDLQTIPGIGKSLAQDLYALGYRSVSDLKNQNPEKMYERLCVINKSHQDPCVLYAFRCAVYFASTKNPEKELLKWWRWKERQF